MHVLGPLGIKTTLESVHLSIDESEVAVFAKQNEQFGALFHTEDFLEGCQAEAEGRLPVYQGKKRSHPSERLAIPTTRFSRPRSPLSFFGASTRSLRAGPLSPAEVTAPPRTSPNGGPTVLRCGSDN